MPVIYNGTSIRPAPYCELTRENRTTADGRILGAVIRATLHGTIVTDKIDNNLVPVDIDSKLTVILEQQTRIRSIFAIDGKTFEIQGWDGATTTKFQAHVVSLVFDEGPWVDKCTWTAVLESNQIAGESVTDNVDSANETWSFEEGEYPRTTKATHTISATGRTVYDSTGNIPLKAWEIAKAFVTTKLALGWSTTGDVIWSPQSGAILAAASAEQPTATNAYNHVVTEQIGELDGTYSVTETWLLSSNNYYEEFSATIQHVFDQPRMTRLVTVSGKVYGLYVDMHDFAARYDNALAAWTNIVQGQVSARAHLPGAGLNPEAFGLQVEHHPSEGYISYTAEFNDRFAPGYNCYDVFNLTVRTSNDDYRSIVRINGSVTAQPIISDVSPSSTFLLDRARSHFVFFTLPTLYGLATSQAIVSRLNPTPLVAEIEELQQGVVNYTYEYDDRTPENVKDEFTVNRKYSREDGKTIVTVEGTITGYRVSTTEGMIGTGDPAERYNNAAEYFAQKEPGLFGIASTYFSLPEVYNVPMTKSVSHNPLGGTVSYAYEFTSVQPPCTPGALSEVVTVVDDIGDNDGVGPVKKMAIIDVPGRAAGPVPQDLGTRPIATRSASIEVIFPPSYSCTSYTAPPIGVLGQFRPTGSIVACIKDEKQWSPNTGRYSRNVSWIYQG